MLFTTVPFIVLLVATLVIYYLPTLRRFQTNILLVSSLVFYGYNSPRLLILLLISAAITSSLSFLVEKGVPRSRLYLICGVALNLAVLTFFKYSPLMGKTFFNQNNDLGEFLIMIPLPIGISFYTFQGISLMVDNWKKPLASKRQILSFGKYLRERILYITFFPQLIAGPIVKARDFLPQIASKEFRAINWNYVFSKLVVGYFLKMVVADNLKDFTNQMEYPYFLEFSSLTLLILLVGYSFQIFADFAGYSSIALGLAGLFGYSLMENFRFPYISKSFREFWKRWHISLSTFLQEYLYIPLGGNRISNGRTYLNLMLTMTLGGIWHGAEWSYLWWGLLHGFFLVSERIFYRYGLVSGRVIYSLIKWFVVTSGVTFAWLFFKLPNIQHALAFVDSIFELKSGYSSTSFNLTILGFGLFVALYHFYYLYESRWPYLIKMKPVLLGIMLFLLIVNSGTSGDFIYFQF